MTHRFKVTVNAFVLYFVTERRSKRSTNSISRRAPKRPNFDMGVLDGLEVLGINSIKDSAVAANSSDGGRRDSARSRRSSTFSSTLRAITEGMRRKRRGKFWQRRHEVRFPPPSPSGISVGAIPNQPDFPGIAEHGETSQGDGISVSQPPRPDRSFGSTPDSHVVFATRRRLSDDSTEDSSCPTRMSFSHDTLAHQNTSVSSHSNHKPYADPVAAMLDDSNPGGERLLSLEDMLREGALASQKAPEEPSSSHSPSLLRPDVQHSGEDLHLFKARRPSAPDYRHPVPCPRSPRLSLPSSSQLPPTTFTPIEIPPPRRNNPFLPQQVPKSTPESSALFGNWQGFQPTTTGTSQPQKLFSPKSPKDESPLTSEVTPRRNDADLEAEIDLSEVGLSMHDV